jgi:hypothetical protein
LDASGALAWLTSTSALKPSIFSVTGLVHRAPLQRQRRVERHEAGELDVDR